MYLSLLYDVDIEASACVLSSRYATELWNFRSQELSLPGMKVPGMEMSWNFHSLERK